MGRIRVYDAYQNVITDITNIDIKPVNIFGKGKKIAVYDGAKIYIYDFVAKTLYSFIPSITIDDVWYQVAGRSGSVVYLLDYNGNILYQYDTGKTLNRVALKGDKKVIASYNGGVMIIDFSTSPPTVKTPDVDPNANHLFVDCDETGYCISTTNVHTQTYHNNSYKGCDWWVIDPNDISVGAVWYGNISVAFCSYAFAGNGAFIVNREQNGALTSVELYTYTLTKITDYAPLASYNNPCKAPATPNSGIGNTDYAQLLLRKTDGTTARIQLGYLIKSGYGVEYDNGNKILYILIDYSNNVRIVRIDRSTGSIIDDVVISTLSQAPDVYRPVVIST